MTAFTLGEATANALARVGARRRPPARSGTLDGDFDQVANAGITALGPAHHLDAQHFLRTGVVGYFEPALSLNHDFSFPT